MKKLFVILASLLIVVSFAATVRADVNDFKITDYQMDLWLGKDEEGRSTLRTKEVITALFPDIDQNHGIERAIPNKYDDHPTHLLVDFSLGNDGDATNNTTTYVSNDNTVVRFGSADTYVHGTKTYSLSYMQRDVTRYFADTNVDEFYWDTNGTEWRVPIEKLDVRLHIDDDIVTQLAEGDTAFCYKDTQGGNLLPCRPERSGNTFSISDTNMAPGNNVTVAIGFKKGTFKPYQMSIGDIFGIIVAAWNGISIAIAGLVSGLMWWLSLRRRSRTKELGTIVPEYIPPKDTSVTSSADVLSMPKSVMTAQLLDLAVRHYIRIYEIRAKSLFKQAEYEIEIIKDTADLRWEEKELLSDMFGGTLDVGSRLSLQSLKNNTAFYGRTLNNDTDLQKKIRGEYALRVRDEKSVGQFRKVALCLVLLGVFTLSIPLIVGGVVIFVLSFYQWPLTDKGLSLRRYLDGLKLYIQVAEQERIRMLQSPEGAAKVGAGTADDPTQLVKLYERVLPYAVLFGQEEQWNKQLGRYYENSGTQPDWYHGVTAFNAANFASGMSGFSTANTYANSSSSSSGGSSGGGSSGGGGGGGGGGGW